MSAFPCLCYLTVYLENYTVFKILLFKSYLSENKDKINLNGLWI